MAEAALSVPRNPALRMVIVSACLGVLGAALQYGMNGLSGPLAPWQVGSLLCALGLWSWAAMEGSALAYVRSGQSRATFFAQSFAYGYFLTVSLVLMQFGTQPLGFSWLLYGLFGVAFGPLLTLVLRHRDVCESEPYFEKDHALTRNFVSRAMFVAWPAVSVLGLSFLVFSEFLPQTSIAILMVLSAAIWPLPYDIAKPARRAFLSMMTLGFALIVAVLMTT